MGFEWGLEHIKHSINIGCYCFGFDDSIIKNLKMHTPYRLTFSKLQDKSTQL